MSLLDSISNVASQGPPWLARIRSDAATSLKNTGLPHRKVEAWRFTPIAPIEKVEFGAAPDGSAQTVAWVEQHLGPAAFPRVIAINGAPVIIPEGVGASRLSETLDDPAVRDHLCRHAPAEHFAALNAALFDDGLVLSVKTGGESVVEVVHVSVAGDTPTVAHPRLLVILDEAAEATLVETYLSRGSARQLATPVTEIVLGPASRLEHIRVTEGIDSSFHIGALAVSQQRASVYNSRVVTFGGAISRVDLRATLSGEGAECHLFGAYHAAGTDLVDHHTFIDHAEPRCSSSESYRGIIDGSGRAVFDGTIAVRRDAQGTSAHQENRNLLLSDGAGVNTKPHLEIDADDVVCSHGATVGALDDTQLYYLRARGIGEDQATAMLTYAFVRSVLDSISPEPVRKRLSKIMLSRLPHGQTIEEMSE